MLELLGIAICVRRDLAEKGVEDRAVQTKVQWYALEHGFAKQLAKEEEQLFVALNLVGVWRDSVGELLRVGH